MKKIFSGLLAFIFTVSMFCAEPTARFITQEAAKKDTVEESISYLKTQVEKLTVLSEKRAVYISLASLQEQMALFGDAQKSYAAAAGIAAGDAQDMPKKSNERIVLDAIRCALSCGDYSTADSYLNSAVRNSRDETVQAYIKLYTQWSALCKADSVEQIQEPVLILQAYTKVDSMKMVKPAVYLTLWYITGDKSYENLLASQYPKSIETAIVKGDVQLLPTPFWFFVPKSGEAVQGTGSEISTENKESSKTSEKTKTEENSEKFTRWQLGLFKTESNAKVLAEELKSKGFDAYIATETRASGTTYHMVLVKENKAGDMADRLRTAGYDCYPRD